MGSQVNLDSVLGLYVEFRDRIHEQSTRNHELEDTFYAYVATRMFVYSFNTYKSIAWLLPSYFYQQAAILLRTLWEAGANFEWISRDPGIRAKKYLEYTAVEHRHRVQRCIMKARVNRDMALVVQLEDELREIEDLLRDQLGAFKYKDKKGRSKWQPRFSGPSLEEIVKEIGGDWLEEHESEYQLGTAYTHAAPGGVLFPMLDLEDVTEVPTVEDVERSIVIGASAIRTMIRVHRHWLRVIGSDDSEYLGHLFYRVCEAVAQVPPRGDTGTPIYLLNLS